MPKLGKEVETPDGFGMVIDLNVLKETVTVRVRKGDNSELKTFPVADIRWFRPPVQQAPRPVQEAAAAPRQAVKKAVPFADHNMEVITSDDAFDTAEPDADLHADVDEPTFETEPLTEELYDDKPTSNWQQAVADALRNAQDSGR